MRKIQLLLVITVASPSAFLTAQWNTDKAVNNPVIINQGNQEVQAVVKTFQEDFLLHGTIAVEQWAAL